MRGRVITIAASVVVGLVVGGILMGPAAGHGSWRDTLRHLQNVSGVYATYIDGPRDIPGGTPASNTNNLMASMSVPKGKFTAIAKVTLENSASSERFVECRLEAEGNTDTSAASLEPTSQQTITMNVNHVFDDGGTYEIRCTDGGGGGTDTRFYNLKLSATEVPLLNNNPGT